MPKSPTLIKITEKEKAAAGILYDANYDNDLLLEREKAKEMLYEYNQLPPRKPTERKHILRTLLGKTGNEFIFEPPFYCDYGYNIEIGENFFANMNLVILDGAKVIIGITFLLRLMWVSILRGTH